LPEEFRDPKVCLPGVLAISGRKYSAADGKPDETMSQFCAAISPDDAVNGFPLIVVVDDSQFTAKSLVNFLWVTFTRSNPAADIDGIGAFSENKHWGYTGSLVIDARLKPHHAAPLETDPEVARRVDPLFARGGPLAGIG
jgi:4-hydroxy-3-polyprenylbenzoate decarboxylase